MTASALLPAVPLLGSLDRNNVPLPAGIHEDDAVGPCIATSRVPLLSDEGKVGTRGKRNVLPIATEGHRPGDDVGVVVRVVEMKRHRSPSRDLSVVILYRRVAPGATQPPEAPTDPEVRVPASGSSFNDFAAPTRSAPREAASAGQNLR